MPRTRRDVAREAKIDEVLEVAERQLLEGGLEGLSMAGVARELGVAQNAVYWYFPSRDELFVATLERILRRALTGKKPPHRGDPAVMSLWFVDRLGEFQSLLAAVHDRARFSPAVAQFRDRIRTELRAMFLGAITAVVPPSDRDLTADAFIAAAEGALVQGLDPKRRTRLLRFTLAKLLGPQGEPRSTLA
jgi:AcrR family transcriptional regulator